MALVLRPDRFPKHSPLRLSRLGSSDLLRDPKYGRRDGRQATIRPMLTSKALQRTIVKGQHSLLLGFVKVIPIVLSDMDESAPAFQIMTKRTRLTAILTLPSKKVK
jgi:hypothetical protein